MALPQDIGYLVDGVVGQILVDGRCLHPLDIVDGKHSLHDSRIWYERHVVLVLSHRVVTLFVESADDSQRYGTEPHHLADGIRPVREEVVDEGLAEDTHLGCRLYVSFCKHLALRNFALAYVEILSIDPLRLRRIIVVSVDPLT